MSILRFSSKIDVGGLKAGGTVLRREFANAGRKVGERYVTRIRQLQRKDTGAERKNTRFYLKSRTNAHTTVRVVNDIIQGVVDELGARPHFPPYKAGTNLFKWVIRRGIASRLLVSQRRALGNIAKREARKAGADKVLTNAIGKFAREQADKNRDKQIERVSFVIARAISRRGLPRPGDPLRRPFDRVHKALEKNTVSVFNFAAVLAVKKINAGVK